MLIKHLNSSSNLQTFSFIHFHRKPHSDSQWVYDKSRPHYDESGKSKVVKWEREEEELGVGRMKNENINISGWAQLSFVQIQTIFVSLYNIKPMLEMVNEWASDMEKHFPYNFKTVPEHKNIILHHKFIRFFQQTKAAAKCG